MQRNMFFHGPSVVLIVLLTSHVTAVQVRSSFSQKDNSVGKVLNMLKELLDKSQEAKQQEAALCTSTQASTHKRLTEIDYDLSTLQSALVEASAAVEKVDSEINVDHSAMRDVMEKKATAKAQLADTQKVRSLQHMEYQSREQDYAESIDALERAIQVVRGAGGDATMLIQDLARETPAMAKVVALLHFAGTTFAETDQPKIPAYVRENSSRLVEVLKDLLDKFRSEKSEMTTLESNQQHAFDLQEMDITNAIVLFAGEEEATQMRLAKLAEAKVNFEKQIVDLQAEISANRGLAQQFQDAQHVHASTCESNQKVRTEEIAALGQAVHILEEHLVKDKYSATMSSLALAFLQFGSSSDHVQSRALDLIRSKAKSLSSHTLLRLVAEAQSSPFEKVVNMIKVLISKLVEESASELDHKQWCDTELKKNKVKREKTEYEVNALNIEIEQYVSEIHRMVQQIAELSAGVSKIREDVQQATDIRVAQEAQNRATIADAKAGKEAVRQAIAVLQQFSNPSASLLQKASEPAEKPLLTPADVKIKSYAANHDASKGIVSILSVVQADFARVEDATTVEEAESERQYSTLMSDLKIETEAKEKAIFDTQMAKDRAEESLHLKEEDLQQTHQTLDAAKIYHNTLKPSCVEVHVHWEDRVAKRKEEIEALREAYNILDGHTDG